MLIKKNCVRLRDGFSFKWERQLSFAREFTAKVKDYFEDTIYHTFEISTSPKRDSLSSFFTIIWFVRFSKICTIMYIFSKKKNHVSILKIFFWTRKSTNMDESQHCLTKVSSSWRESHRLTEHSFHPWYRRQIVINSPVIHLVSYQALGEIAR